MVVFENVLSHTSTRKSPKYLNLHKLFAEFYLGFFVCQNELGLGAGWNEVSGGWLLVRALALRDSASSRPRGPFPQRALFGARGSDLSVVTCRLLVTVCTPLLLKQAPNLSSLCTKELSAAEGSAGRYCLHSAVACASAHFCLACGSLCGWT